MTEEIKVIVINSRVMQKKSLSTSEGTLNALYNNKPQQDSSGVSRVLIWKEIYKNNEGRRKAGTVKASNDDGSQQYTQSKGRRRHGRTYLGGNVQIRNSSFETGDVPGSGTMAKRRKLQGQEQQWQDAIRYNVTWKFLLL